MNDVFLTFDIDWASDDVLNSTIDLLEEYNVEATFFVTHSTPVLARLRSNNLFELGIHPNFNKILSGDEDKSYIQIIDEILEIVPEAVSVRAHALAQSSYISNEYQRRGLLYDLNTLIPVSAGFLIKPFLSSHNLITIPFFFEDDTYFFAEDARNNIEDYYTDNPECIKVFNFHPIHVYLNTYSSEQYNQSKTISKDITELKKIINTSIFGTRDFLLQVIEYGKKHDYKFNKINRIGSLDNAT